MDTTTANNKDVAVIDQQKDLAHLNALVTEIQTLKLGYVDLVINGPEDKDGYEKVRAAIGVLRPKRTGLEAERKSVVKPYNDTVKFINGEYEKITTLIQEGPGGELELKEKKEAIDHIIKEQEEEKKRQEEAKINNRINELIAAGMVFDGSWYVIGDNDLGIPFTTVGIADVRTMSDLQHQNTLELVTEKAQKINAEKERLAEIERIRLQEEEKEKQRQQEELKQQQQQLQEQQAEMKRQQDELKKQQEALDKQKREAEQQQQKIEQDRINGILRSRFAVLTGMGLQYNEQEESFDYNGEALVSDATGIAEYNDTAWLALIETLKTTIAKKKADAEAFLKKQQEEEKEKLAQQEKERLAGLSDKQKMQEYIDTLYNVPVPPMTTKVWKGKAAMVRDFITDNRPA